MTYDLAASIRSLVYSLNKTWLNDHFECALVKRTYPDGSWECHLITRKGSLDFKGELWAIAIAVEKAACGITIKESTYNRGTKEPEIVPSICLY